MTPNLCVLMSSCNVSPELQTRWTTPSSVWSTCPLTVPQAELILPTKPAAARVS